MAAATPCNPGCNPGCNPVYRRPQPAAPRLRPMPTAAAPRLQAARRGGRPLPTRAVRRAARLAHELLRELRARLRRLRRAAMEGEHYPDIHPDPACPNLACPDLACPQLSSPGLPLAHLTSLRPTLLWKVTAFGTCARAKSAEPFFHHWQVRPLSAPAWCARAHPRGPLRAATLLRSS